MRKRVAPCRIQDPEAAPPVVVEPAPPPEQLPPAAAVAELLSFRWAWLSHLPLPAALECRLVGAGAVAVWLRTSNQAPRAPVGVACFVGPELMALGVAAELGRAYPATLRGWVARRAGREPWALGMGEAMGDVPGGRFAWANRWTCRQVLRRLGLQLDQVRL